MKVRRFPVLSGAPIGRNVVFRQRRGTSFSAIPSPVPTTTSVPTAKPTAPATPASGHVGRQHADVSGWLDHASEGIEPVDLPAGCDPPGLGDLRPVRRRRHTHVRRA